MLTCELFLPVLCFIRGSVSVPFLSVHAVGMNDSLSENFKMIFNDFQSHAINIHIFEN
jgi:hypothetical protein